MHVSFIESYLGLTIPILGCDSIGCIARMHDGIRKASLRVQRRNCCDNTQCNKQFSGEKAHCQQPEAASAKGRKGKTAAAMICIHDLLVYV